MLDTRKLFKDIKLDWISLAALLAIATLIWGVIWVVRLADTIDKQEREQSKYREAALARFSPLIQQYSSYPSTDESDSQPTYIRGKAIAVGVGDYQVVWPLVVGDLHTRSFEGASYKELEHPQPFLDGLYFELPDEIRATSPAEVQTRILVEWHREVVGRYKLRYATGPGQTEAYRFRCTLTIIDDTRGAIVGRREFVGDMPPSELGPTIYTDFGRLPLEQIVETVANLPRH